MIEKRSDYRYRYTTKVNYGSINNTGKGFAQDISLGGMFVNGMHNFPIGADILVTVPFPNSNRYASLEGTVARTTAKGFAVSFKRQRRIIHSNNDWSSQVWNKL